MLQLKMITFVLMRENRWVYKTTEASTIVESLSSEINVSKSIAKILCYRSIDTFDKAKSYFRCFCHTLEAT